MIIVDVLLQDRSDGAFDDFKENSQRVLQTIISLYNDEAPPERQMRVQFRPGGHDGFPNPKRHLH
jgi:hypothetical protein